MEIFNKNVTQAYTVNFVHQMNGKSTKKYSLGKLYLEKKYSEKQKVFGFAEKRIEGHKTLFQQA